MIELAIGLGVLLNLVGYELLGRTAGGAVVPGYLALFLDQPGRIASTLVAAVLTLGAVRLLSRVAIIYGRRKFAAMMLVGFIVNGLINEAVRLSGGWLGPSGTDLRVIGFIVPGLLANEMHEQGIAATVAMALLSAVIVRLAVAGLARAGVFGGV
ncbi:MAG: poly-gamma-glutamate biosynthesis protein PgsC [Firmicutes bacterium]|nr:poly-gamma-glutamate biosynthesis protein PgsC [Bacillota bacterium]